MKRVTYTLPPGLVAQLQKKSEDSGLAMSEIIRRALEVYFKKDSK